MINNLKDLSPILLALFATIFTYVLTLLGASLVFFFKNVKKNIMDAMLAIAAGVMIAASVWSLLIPSIEMAETQGKIAWIPAAIGFLLGIVFLLVLDSVIPHLHLESTKPEGIKTK